MNSVQKTSLLRSFFYGKNDPGLEEQFSSIEGRLGGVLRDIENGGDLAKHNQFLTEYAWLQAIRTNSFRDRITSTLSELLSASSRTTGTDGARRKLLATGKSELSKFIESLSQDQKRAAAMQLGVPIELAAEQLLSDKINSGELSSEFSKLLKMAAASSALQDGMTHGHNQSLSTLINEGLASPDIFNPIWKILCFSDNSLILGDSCITDVASNGNARPLLDISNWRRIQFPINPNVCLIGLRDNEEATDLSAAEINRCSAACSLEQFYGATRHDLFFDLIPMIGSNIAMLTTEDKQHVIDSFWK